MTDAEFQMRIAALHDVVYREDFEAALYELYAVCQPGQRAALRDQFHTGVIKSPLGWRNPTDYFRSDLTPEQKARRGLHRMSLEWAEGRDDRDNLLSLAHDYHTLAVLGFDAGVILEEVARISTPPCAAFLRSFAGRDPKDRSLEAFGLVVVQTPNGPVVDRRR